ncbi:EAL domain-containing response regulator [Vreelandella gomseomensis]|uniref:EAL domain-containing response regulator n=1 Tax=Vreelandella gomseomensis TaxID=370766 RepID=A0ABU1G790_9GAMM|nr:EAL domain-containing response regulator [Halomonas gomseomensis]MDR5873355.1 EAL domain-containing response regulator [Halomonas gomseomensis]
MIRNALVIDDDADIQLLGTMLLQKLGYNVATAGCLGELARQPSLLNTELILLDLGLGEFTGLDIIDYLHDLRLNAAIIVTSGCSEEAAAHTIESGNQKGLCMLGFLPKTKLMTGLAPFIDSLKQSSKPPVKAELEKALRDRELFLAFQPKQDLHTGNITGVEALVRWQDPQRGVLYPDSFIPLAEKQDLILPLTWHVIELALAQQARWQSEGIDLNVAINVPAAFIQAEGMLATFDRLTQRHHISLDKITLELTESAGIECLGYARHVLETLRRKGCQLALDDFGTGYSSMVQLYRLPFTELKIDKSFVSRIDHDDDARAITLSIIDLGKRLGLKVVAEGIETSCQHTLLAQYGCTLGQGYFIARPLARHALDTWLTREPHLAQ